MADSDPKLSLRDVMSPKSVINLGMSQWSSLRETVWIRRSFEEFLIILQKTVFPLLVCIAPGSVWACLAAALPELCLLNGCLHSLNHATQP